MKKHKLNRKQFIIDEIDSIEFIGEQLSIDIEIGNPHMLYVNDILACDCVGAE